MADDDADPVVGEDAYQDAYEVPFTRRPLEQDETSGFRRRLPNLAERWLAADRPNIHRHERAEPK